MVVLMSTEGHTDGRVEPRDTPICPKPYCKCCLPRSRVAVGATLHLLSDWCGQTYRAGTVGG